MASATRTRRDRTEKTLRPVRPNLGLEIEDRRRLEALIVEMDKSVRYWLEAAYKANEPAVAALAQDELSAAALKRVMRELSRRWLKRFDDAATKLAEYFATAVSKRSDAALKKILKDGGFSVEWKPTLAQRDIMQASVQENVALIKSIPANYLSQVEQSVMRSVQTGRDLKQLSDDLQKHFGVTKRRAAFIAQSQNNLATAALTRARQIESGIDRVRWVHSSAGKVPRPSHVKAGRDRVEYDPKVGWFDPHENKFVLPGQLPRCRCVGAPVIKGFS